MSSDLFAHLITVLAVGVVLAFPFFVPESWRRTARRVVVTSVLVFVFACFGIVIIGVIHRLSLGESGFSGLSYDEYRRCVGTDAFDPIGATDICHRCDTAIDGCDSWEKLRIEPGAFERLLARRSLDMQDVRFASYNGEAAGPVHKFTSERGYIPAHWPNPMRTPPKWWDATAQARAHCTCWELQVSTDTGSGRAKGWYWLYDPDSKTLWMWDWNHQHFRLSQT